MEDTYGIFLIATGNYVQYLKNTIVNIKQKFLPYNKKLIFLSIDDKNYADQLNTLSDNMLKIHINIIKQKGYPSDTLYRFEYFLQFDDDVFKQVNYLCFLNVNIKINNLIANLDITNYELFFVSHPGNKNCNMFIKSVESNKKNTAYLNKTLQIEYICGGFHGGKTRYFLDMCKILKNKIQLNDNNNICAKWHDESHLNWYYYYYKNKINICTLGYEYMTCIIEPLKKNHQMVRSHNYHIIGWSGNILIDILNGCKEYCNGYNVGFQFENIKYNNSRNGILKNFFRVENSMKITRYPTRIKCNCIDENKIKEFVSMLNINFNTRMVKKFQKKYGDYVGVILLGMNVDAIKKINKDHPGKKLFYRPQKNEHNLIKMLSLKKIICDDDFLCKIFTVDSI